MWLLKLHIAVSILSMITFLGFWTVFKETIRENGWLTNIDRKKKKGWWIFFVPMLNIAAVMALCVTITMTKDEFNQLMEERKKKGNKE